jgi:alpha-glucosidase
MIFATLLATAPVVIASPDRINRIEVSEDGSSFTVSRKGEQVLAPSPLGLTVDGAQAFGPLKLERVQRESRNRVIPLTASKASNALDHYNGAQIVFREVSGPKRTLIIDTRAYNDGVAFRYRLPGGVPIALSGEKTVFRFAGDPKCLVTEYSNSHERDWETLNISKLDPAKKYDLLTSCSTESGRTHFAIAQSDLSHYAGASLKPVEGGLAVEVTKRPDRAGVAVISPNGLTSAWRAVMLGNRAGDLIQSNLIGNLAPQAQGDFSWVRPGLAAWDWWSGPTAGEKPTMERLRRFIDFAAAFLIS